MTEKLCPGCPGDPNETCCKPELRVQVWQQQAGQQPAAAVSDEREAFEAWATSCWHDTSKYEGLYKSVQTHALWCAWETRAILALRPQAVPMMDEPFLKVHKGEICYKSDADDQSYGMWCPVNWDTEHGFSDGTVFYAHHGITQRADGAQGTQGGA